MKKRTDKQRLDELQSLVGRYSKNIECRWSSTGRGWRLHESSEGQEDIRVAIDRFLDYNKK